METSNAYTIRLSLLKMAKELAMDDYFAKLNAMNSKYQQQLAIDSRAGKITPLDIPKIPTPSQITKLAEELNLFVSKK